MRLGHHPKGLNKMINQIRRIWADNGANDKDFTIQEEQLRSALEHLRDAAHSLGRATETLLDVINAKAPSVASENGQK